jgi:hypothetical protein
MLACISWLSGVFVMSFFAMFGLFEEKFGKMAH